MLLSRFRGTSKKLFFRLLEVVEVALLDGQKASRNKRKLPEGFNTWGIRFCPRFASRATGSCRYHTILGRLGIIFHRSFEISSRIYQNRSEIVFLVYSWSQKPRASLLSWFHDILNNLIFSFFHVWSWHFGIDWYRWILIYFNGFQYILLFWNVFVSSCVDPFAAMGRKRVLRTPISR